MRRLYLLILLSVILLNGCAKIVVVNVPKAKPQNDGVFYALPKTVVRVNLVVEKVENKAAPFAEFAEIFAPGSETVCKAPICTEEEKKFYRMKRGATMTTFGEPDPEHVYMVKFIGRGELDQSVTMQWNEAGVITGAEAKVTNRTIDIAVSSLKFAAGLSTRFASGSATDNVTVPSKCDDPTSTDEWVLPILGKYPNNAAKSQLIYNYCGIPCDKRESWGNYDGLLARATKAHYQEVFPLEKKREDLQVDKPYYDPASLIKDLDVLIERKIRVLFLGTQTITPWESVFEVRDFVAGSMPRPTTLLRLNKAKGFCVQEDLLAPGVKPVPGKDLITGDECANALDVSLKLDFYPAQTSQLFDVVRTNAAINENGERSFRYRIPAQVKAEVTYNKSVFGAGVMAIAQLGTIASLPAKRNSKTLAYDLKFVEATGALKSFTLGTTGGIDSGVIDQLSTVSNSIVDARSKARDNEAASQDELNILKREAEILKLRDQICELRKKNGLTCEIQQ